MCSETDFMQEKVNFHATTFFSSSETCTRSIEYSDQEFFLRGQNCSKDRLLVLLRANPGVGIGNPDSQLGGTLHQSLPVLDGDSTSDLGAEGLVGHHQDFQLLDVVDEDLLEARGQHVPGVGGATVTNVGHLVHSLELPCN